MATPMLTAAQVAARLGVQRATVYAYVSRGLLSRTLADDGRTSRFDAAEVDRLARRGRPRAPGRRPGRVDVALATTITGIDGDRLVVRGHDVADLVEAATFEAVAELLWTGALPGPARVTGWPAPDEAVAAVATVAGALPADAPAAERFAAVAAALACTEPSRVDLRPEAVARHARRLIGAFVGSLPHRGRPAPAPAAARRPVAAALLPRLSADRPTAARVRALDAALVLLADHELATSTLAARVAASTRADPYAVVLAGLGAVSGPRHGKAALDVHRLLLDAAATTPAAAVARVVAQGSTPGVGHPVYTGDDPRATCLLDHLDGVLRGEHRALVDEVADALVLGSGSRPNVDYALGALAFATGMPVGATEAVFAVARTAGWVAHALEEYGEAPLRFRAQAIYDGPRP